MTRDEFDQLKAKEEVIFLGSYRLPDYAGATATVVIKNDTNAILSFDDGSRVFVTPDQIEAQA